MYFCYALIDAAQGQRNVVIPMKPYYFVGRKLEPELDE
jgi:hypothetical protein